MEINISQMNVVCHVDDLKVSYKETFEVTRLTSYLNGIYFLLKVNHGKLQKYLGMYLY